MAISFDDYLKKFNNKAEKYIPQKKDWTPSDEAVYGVKDVYKVPVKKAQELKFNAIKYAFKNSYEKNDIYKNFCKEKKFSPDDLKKHDDIEKIPLLPNNFYKNYPDGKEFATWLANMYSINLPKIKISGKNPTYDNIIDSFNNSGMRVCYSSGTSGRHTFIPRDTRTFNIAEYSLAKGAISMAYPIWDYDMYGYLLMPNPEKTNLFVGRVATIYFDVVHDVQVSIDREINTETISMSMSGGKGGLKSLIVKAALGRMYKKIVNNIISWLEKNEKEKNKIMFAGAPFLLYAVVEKMKETGQTFDFSDRGAILTGGGWKAQENKRIPVEEFRKIMEEMLGINPEYCLDAYAMVEGNGFMVHCPEGHYLHVPHTYYHPMVLDDEYKPMGYGETGRFAFIDGTTTSYPGFMITGDKVKLLEHCPVCDRPGPVLEPEVHRAAGQEIRGCAEEVRRMVSSDIGK